MATRTYKSFRKVMEALKPLQEKDCKVNEGDQMPFKDVRMVDFKDKVVSFGNGVFVIPPVFSRHWTVSDRHNVL